MMWVKANVAGKVTTLEGSNWQVLIALIVNFVKDHRDQRISWGDLMFDSPRMQMEGNGEYKHP